MNKNYWAILSLLLLVCVIILKLFYAGTDISLYPVRNTGKTYTKEKVWLISYADKGIYLQNQNNLVMSAAMYQVFDVIIPYQPKHIEPDYYKEHEDILKQKRGAGYWLWKPYFILKTLNLMAEGDILIYVDASGVFREGIYDLIELARKNNIVVFPNFHNNRGFVKKIVLDKMMEGDESYLDKVQLDGSIILLRNNLETRTIIANWLKYCEDSALLTDAPSANEYPDFKDHRHDQAILSVMYHKNPESFYLYDPYPARMKSFILTRRKNQCSMIPITFSEKIEFSWLDDIKYRSIIWLIGCQRFKGR